MDKPACIDHLEFAGERCPDCGLDVDLYGNTEDQFDYCSFPNCGCDGARLCMAARGASARACDENVEGMWTGKTKAQREAVFKLLGGITKEQSNG
jgi:hypothetical protein